MSSCGQFVTQCIDCRECFQKVKNALDEQVKNHHVMYTQIPAYAFAGQVMDTYDWGEVQRLQFFTFYDDFIPCHPVRIAILTDVPGGALITVNPDGEVVENANFGSEEKYNIEELMAAEEWDIDYETLPEVTEDL